MVVKYFCLLCSDPVLRQYVSVITVNLSILNFGIAIAWTSPILPKLQAEDNEVLGRPITDDEGSLIASITTLSCMFALPVTAYIVDVIGRKYCFIISTIPRITSYVLYIAAKDVWTIMLGRVLNGISDAIMFSAVSMYASEVASNEIRGSLGSILQIFSALGIMVTFGIGPFIDYTTANITMLCICTLTSLPLLFIPDSPYFLYKKGKIEEAKGVLEFFRGSLEVAEIELNEYSLVGEESAKITELVKSKPFLKAAGLVLVLGAGAALCGFGVITLFVQSILESTGSSLSSSVASLVIGLIQIFASFISTFLSDKIGRKPILILGLIGMAIGMTSLGTHFYVLRSGYAISGVLNFLPLISLMLCVFCFSAGVSSLLWPLIAELFDGRGRAVGTNFGTFSFYAMTFLVTTFFAKVVSIIGPASTYWIFAVNNVLLLAFIYFFLPETKGKSFLEIQTILSKTKISI